MIVVSTLSLLKEVAFSNLNYSQVEAENAELKFFNRYLVGPWQLWEVNIPIPKSSKLDLASKPCPIFLKEGTIVLYNYFKLDDTVHTLSKTILFGDTKK